MPIVPTIGNSALAAVFFGIFIALIVITLAAIGWILWYRNDPIIRRKSPLFMSLIGLGIIMVLLGGLWITIGLTDSARCILYVFFLITGMSLILACLMAKSWRIYRIFSNASARAIIISDFQLLIFPAIILSLAWIQFFVYSFAGGLIVPKRIVAFSNQYYVFDLCESPTSWLQTFQVISYYAFLFILIFITALMAWLSRHASAQFRESKMIAVIIYLYLCMGAIYVPLYNVQGNFTNSQDTRLAIVVLNVGILMLATILCIFLPTILEYRSAKRKRRD